VIGTLQSEADKSPHRQFRYGKSANTDAECRMQDRRLMCGMINQTLQLIALLFTRGRICPVVRGYWSCGRIPATVFLMELAAEICAQEMN